MNERIHGLLMCLAMSLLLGACGRRTENQAGDGGFVAVSGARFVDPAGKPLILHGVNVVNKNKNEGYIGGLGQSDFAAIRGWGMNCVRLGILWDGLEPEAGRIDEAYLERVARLVAAAKAQDLYVLLDMHQDLYSGKFSDGAPVWATLDEGKPHTPGAVWSDAYYSSEAVQTALDHFWANSPGPDGVGLQDHYAQMWQNVARRFASEPAVVGYDLMNEPFPGQDGRRAREAGIAALAQLLAKCEGTHAPAPEKLGEMFAAPEGRKQVTAWLGNLTLFTAMVDAAGPVMQDFERTRLMPMYTRVARAIRQVDTRHILFLESAMSSNVGIPSVIEPLKDEQGNRDPRQAYAPHAYDIVTDTDSIDLNSNQRVELILRRHAEAAERLQMPVLIGEWGAYYLNAEAVEPARYMTGQFDKLRFSDTYWSYEPQLTQSPLLAALHRYVNRGR
jgi:endoglycosylceramidase